MSSASGTRSFTLRHTLQHSAKERVRANFLLLRIAEKEKLEVKEQDVAQRVYEMAARYEIPVNKLVKDLQRREGLQFRQPVPCGDIQMAQHPLRAHAAQVVGRSRSAAGIGSWATYREAVTALLEIGVQWFEGVRA